MTTYTWKDEMMDALPAFALVAVMLAIGIPIMLSLIAFLVALLCAFALCSAPVVLAWTSGRWGAAAAAAVCICWLLLDYEVFAS